MVMHTRYSCVFVLHCVTVLLCGSKQFFIERRLPEEHYYKYCLLYLHDYTKLWSDVGDLFVNGSPVTIVLSVHGTCYDVS